MKPYLHVSFCSFQCSDHALNQFVDVSDTLQFPLQPCLASIFVVLVPVMVVGRGLGPVGQLSLGGFCVGGRGRCEEVLVV